MYRQQKLIYELNSSGKYFAFKEQLKHSVVKIVREKYLKTANFQDKQELQVGEITRVVYAMLSYTGQTMKSLEIDCCMCVQNLVFWA